MAKDNIEKEIFVIEDELIIADNICSILNSFGYKTPEPAISYTEAIEYLENNNPDLVLIDIILAGKKDGIDLAETINERFNIPFLFLTSNADEITVGRAKNTYPKGYIVKPFTKKEIYAAIEIALMNSSSEIKENEDWIFVGEKYNLKKLKFKDIAYIQSVRVYNEFYTVDNKRYLVRGNLSDIEKQLPKDFVRIHRSYIINIKHLQALRSNTVTISNQELPMSKTYKHQIMDMFNK